MLILSNFVQQMDLIRGSLLCDGWKIVSRGHLQVVRTSSVKVGAPSLLSRTASNNLNDLSQPLFFSSFFLKI